MSENIVKESSENGSEGVIFAITAFLIWGLSSIYWKQLKAVPAFEILMHRMVWSFIFLVPVLFFQNSVGEFTAALKNRRTVLILLSTTLIVGLNWFIFIWAINNNQLLQASFGYYINPLINVLLGVVFLKEKLRPLQKIAVALASAGVLYMTISYGSLPWIALCLAISFGFYGLVRKVAPVSSLVGLSVETLLLSVPALGYLLYLNSSGSGAFMHGAVGTDFLLAGSAIVTALPLLLFTKGARRLRFSTIVFMQYIAPTCGFFIAIFLFEEPLSFTQLITFVVIWIALAIYSFDSVLQQREEANQ
jgi:chloramphenicol-sensitive protein RarD